MCPAFGPCTSTCGMMHMWFSPMSSGADDWASMLVPSLATLTDGESRADMMTERMGQSHMSLKTSCAGWGKFNMNLPDGEEKGEWHIKLSCTGTVVMGWAMAEKEETTRISDQWKVVVFQIISVPSVSWAWWVGSKILRECHSISFASGVSSRWGIPRQTLFCLWALGYW